MKTSHKAILLSALVLPGLGQLTLKRYKTGIAIIVIVLISVYRMMSLALEQANAIVDRLIGQGGAADITAITDAANQATNPAGDSMINLYLWIILICWLISLLDAWRAGRQAE